MDKANLFSVCHPRSGTSSLHHYLKQHLDIFMTVIKEPIFFQLTFEKKVMHFIKNISIFHIEPKFNI
jgi:hypothetical protein